MRPDRTLQLAESPFLSEDIIEDLYVPIPTKQGVKLMREDVLDDLSDEQFHQYLNALESSGMGLGGKRKDARIKRREDRKANKQSKQDAKTAIKTAKAESIKAGTYKPAFSTAVESIGGVVGKFLNPDSTSKDISLQYSDTGTTTPKDNTKLFLYIGGGLLGLGLLYVVLKPKKKGRR